MHKNGCTEREKVKILKAAVRNTIAREHEIDSIEYSGHSGRRRTTSETTDTKIQVISKTNMLVNGSERNNCKYKPGT